MNTARRASLMAVGGIVALAGFEHGLGELLQGPVAPDDVVIQSWPNSAFYRSLQGEPAMTVIPNLAVSGIVTMLTSILLLAWVTRFADRKGSAFVIAALSVVLLLVGGGFGPPVLGLILALAAVKVNSELASWRRHSAQPLTRIMARAWPWLLGACVIAWLVALFGIAALDYFAEIESVGLTVFILATAFMLLPLTFLASFARDAVASSNQKQVA